MMTKEKPILFSTSMVRAILDGRKTQTRRTIKPQPKEGKHIAVTTGEKVDEEKQFGVMYHRKDTLVDFHKCPYGNPGDFLWVRESFYRAFADTPNNYEVAYKADYGPDPSFSTKTGWKPSIHMPKPVARIWLRIKKVLIEKAQSISPRDCIEEGIEPAGAYIANTDSYSLYRNYITGGATSEPTESFKTLWIEINGAESWKSKPWVWVVEFEILSTNGKPNYI